MQLSEQPITANNGIFDGLKWLLYTRILELIAARTVFEVANKQKIDSIGDMVLEPIPDSRLHPRK